MAWRTYSESHDGQKYVGEYKADRLHGWVYCEYNSTKFKYFRLLKSDQDADWGYSEDSSGYKYFGS